MYYKVMQPSAHRFSRDATDDMVTTKHIIIIIQNSEFSYISWPPRSCEG